MTIEQGKPLAESGGETLVGADRIDWMAEEGPNLRACDTGKGDGIYQFVMKEPVDLLPPLPLNFPLNQILQKVLQRLLLDALSS